AGVVAFVGHLRPLDQHVVRRRVRGGDLDPGVLPRRERGPTAARTYAVSAGRAGPAREAAVGRRTGVRRGDPAAARGLSLGGRSYGTMTGSHGPPPVIWRLRCAAEAAVAARASARASRSAGNALADAPPRPRPGPRR